MKSTTLLIDHHQNTDKGLVIHKAGSTVELPDEDVDYINFAVVEIRKERRAQALAIPGTPEYDAAMQEDVHAISPDHNAVPQHELTPTVSNTP